VKCLYPEVSDYITGDLFAVMQCNDCRLAWTSPVPSNFDAYYPAAYRRYNFFILLVLKLLYRRRALRWTKFFPVPGSVLEIGCGDGIMLDVLRSHGWQPYGTERTEEMTRFAKEHFNLTVYTEDKINILQSRKYELIVMFQVLEHLADALEKLKLAAGMLAENGRLVVAVPNFLSWQSCYAKENWFHLDVPRHLFHFSPAAFEKLSELAGLKMQSISFNSLEHDPYGWVQSILNVQFQNKNRLTKLLMKMVPIGMADLPALLLAALLTPAAFLLSFVSWQKGKGAIIEVVFTKKI
jgi:SAM-dependent methyltransferase